MEDIKTEILYNVKGLLKIEDEENDKRLELIIENVIDAVMSYCRIDVLPRQLISFIPSIAAEQFPRVEQEGVKSVTEGERRVEYSFADNDFLGGYAMRLKPFISRKVKVPSEMESGENESV